MIIRIRIHNTELTGATDVQFVSCEDLLAVLFYGNDTVSLWNGRDETWLADVKTITFCEEIYNILDIGVSKNLLALTASSYEGGYRIFFWGLSTNQQADISPQYIGMAEVGRWGELARYIHLNEKWVVILPWQGKEVHIIKQKELFSEDQRKVKDMAKFVDSPRPGNPWRQFTLKSMNSAVGYVSMQPGNSSLIAMEFESFDPRRSPSVICSTEFRILNLETLEIVFKLPGVMDAGLHPTSWWGDSFLFLRKLEPSRVDENTKLQMVILDPNQRIITKTAKELEREATCLFPGLTADFSGASRLFSSEEFLASSRLSFNKARKTKRHVDAYGMVVFDNPHLFFAAIE